MYWASHILTFFACWPLSENHLHVLCPTYSKTLVLTLQSTQVMGLYINGQIVARKMPTRHPLVVCE